MSESEYDHETEKWACSKITIMEEGETETDLVIEITAYDSPTWGYGSHAPFIFSINSEYTDNRASREEVSLESAKQIRDFLSYAISKIESRGNS